MAERSPYCRVYWTIVDDERFATIYSDDANLATWLRLLIIADGAWPASASLPVTVKARAVKALVDAGLVELAPHGRFRIHGMNSERNARSSAARNAAAVRWQSERINASMPSRDEQSKAKTSRAETSREQPSQDEPNRVENVTPFREKMTAHGSKVH